MKGFHGGMTMKGVIIVVFLLLFLVVSLYEFAYQLKARQGLKAYTKQVRGKIIQITSEKVDTYRYGYYVYYALVRYCVPIVKQKKVDRIYFTNKISIGDKENEYKKGDYIRINYIPDDPQKSIYEPYTRKEVNSQLIASILFLAVAVMLIGWSIVKYISF